MRTVAKKKFDVAEMFFRNFFKKTITTKKKKKCFISTAKVDKQKKI